MKDPNLMNSTELMELISIFPTKSVCEREKLEKLKELFRFKLIEEAENGSIQDSRKSS